MALGARSLLVSDVAAVDVVAETDAAKIETNYNKNNKIDLKSAVVNLNFQKRCAEAFSKYKFTLIVQVRSGCILEVS